jgi:heme exporter protein B
LLYLIKKEIVIEFKNKSALAGIVLYLSSTVFLTYVAFGFRFVDPMSWNALFWTTTLFTAVNSVAKSFIGEKKGKDIYLYSLTGAENVILSKIFYNALLCTLLSISGYFLFTLFLKNPVQDVALFLVTLILSSIGFAASLTLLSGISSKANNGNILMAVLSFPVVISILLLSIKITKNCIDGLERSASFNELTILVSINCLVIAMSYLLFPYIWRS